MATTTRVITRAWYSGVTLTNTVYASDLTTVLRVARTMTEFPAGSGSFVLIDTEWDTSWANAIDVFSDGALPDEIQAAAPLVTNATTSLAGSDQVTLTVTVGGVPVQNASAWITTDALGRYVAEGPIYTNSEGRATFLLTAGLTYYLWAQKDGINPIKGQVFVAVAD